MIYKISKFFAMVFYKLFYPHKIYGKENIPKDENFILVSNHYAKIDIVVVSEFLKKRPYFLGKKELTKNKFAAKIMTRYGLIPIDRDKADVNAIKECFAVLKRGDNLIIFPEGTRNKRDDELKELKGGASLIALKAKVKVVPFAMMTRFKMFRKNYGCIGKPFDFSEYYGQRADSELIKKLEEKMFSEIDNCRSVCEGESKKLLEKK